MQTYSYNDKVLKLSRYPYNEPGLLPWNAADEYLLNLYKTKFNQVEKPLIINDDFGILSLALSQSSPAFLNDSFINREALKFNAELNNIDIKNIDFKTFTPDAQLESGPYDLVFLKIPKSLLYLRFILDFIKPALRKNTVVLSAGMTKHLSGNIKDIFSDTIGETTVGKVVRKAVVFTSTNDAGITDSELFESNLLKLEELDVNLRIFPNVFSNNRLDDGTRLLIKNIPDLANKKVIDLGCGSGIIGLIAKLRNPEIEISLIDESFLAVESAKLTFSENNVSGNFHIGDGAEGLTGKNYDIVLSNPPFHSGHSMCLEAATRHFAPVYNCLVKGGSFIVVCNKSLNYKPHLQKIFQTVNLLDENSKYFLFEAVK